jgi:sulfonate transport system substrate-binding protein
MKGAFLYFINDKFLIWLNEFQYKINQEEIKMRKLITLLAVIISVTFLLAACSTASGEENPKKVVLDYAYYSPTSLALKEFGWAEEAFEKEGIEVEWVLSQGSNKALEFLNSKSVDFGSTAGAAALIAKSNG